LAFSKPFFGFFQNPFLVFFKTLFWFFSKPFSTKDKLTVAKGKTQLNDAFVRQKPTLESFSLKPNEKSEVVLKAVASGIAAGATAAKVPCASSYLSL